MDRLIVQYFNKSLDNGIKLGQLITCLGVIGKEKEGPKKVALRLL